MSGLENNPPIKNIKPIAADIKESHNPINNAKGKNARLIKKAKTIKLPPILINLFSFLFIKIMNVSVIKIRGTNKNRAKLKK